MNEMRAMDLVMLDRDGVINRDHPQSIRSVAEFELLPGAAQGIALLNKAHIPVAVVTNQAIVGRGDLSLEELHRIKRVWIKCMSAPMSRSSLTIAESPLRECSGKPWKDLTPDRNILLSSGMP
jgi:HAD superfamily hydrolase (TIGR01662 family)